MTGHSIFRHPVFGEPPGGGRLSPIPLSMIDVVFQLLIFLLLGQFPVYEGLLSVPLAGPGALPAVASPARTVWVQVRADRDGGLSYRLNDWPAVRSPDELLGHVRDWVRAAGPEQLAVVIGAEPGVPFERLVELWEGCRRVGVRQLALPGTGGEGK